MGPRGLHYSVYWKLDLSSKCGHEAEGQLVFVHCSSVSPIFMIYDISTREFLTCSQLAKMDRCKTLTQITTGNCVHECLRGNEICFESLITRVLRANTSELQ